MKLLLCFLCIVYSGLCSAQDPLRELDGYVEQSMKAWRVPGVAIAVIKDDKVIYARGFGVLENGKADKVDQNTVFAIGSNTKIFTSTALGLLVQEKKLSWDDRISKYLPELELYDPYVTHELTIRDSLCHRSGLGTWEGDLVAWGSRLDRKELLKRVRYLQPAFPFRSGYGYSNIMFLAAGETIPVITGKTWDVFIQERFLNALGMTRSTLSTVPLANMSNVAQPHTTDGNQVVRVPWRNLDNIGPAGSINSSVLDMTQWIRMHLNRGMLNGKRFVEEGILDEIYTPHNPLKVSKALKDLFPSRHFSSYGLGIGISDLHGRVVLSHTGGTDGMISRVVMVPEERLGIVILTNQDDHSLDAALYLRIFDAFMGQPEKDWNLIFLEQHRNQKARQIKQEQDFKQSRVSRTQPTLPIEKYSGQFKNEHYGSISIVNGNPLRLKLEEHPGIECNLEHWHYDTFLCDWNDVEFGETLIQFDLDQSASVSRVSFKVREDFIDPLEYVFTRITSAK